MDKIFNLYKTMLLIHIQTKTVDKVFHETTEAFYELLFDIFHTISEKRQDIEEDKSMDCEIAKKSAYDVLEEVKKDLDKMIASKQTYGMDNLLRGLYDKLEFACGTARGLLEEEEKEEMLPKIQGPKLK